MANNEKFIIRYEELTYDLRLASAFGVISSFEFF